MKHHLSECLWIKILWSSIPLNNVLYWLTCLTFTKIVGWVVRMLESMCVSRKTTTWYLKYHKAIMRELQFAQMSVAIYIFDYKEQISCAVLPLWCSLQSHRQLRSSVTQGTSLSSGPATQDGVIRNGFGCLPKRGNSLFCLVRKDQISCAVLPLWCSLPSLR